MTGKEYTFEKQQFQIACRSYFPSCKFETDKITDALIMTNQTAYGLMTVTFYHALDCYSIEIGEDLDFKLDISDLIHLFKVLTGSYDRERIVECAKQNVRKRAK